MAFDFSSHEHLKGTLLTSDGWEGLRSFTEHFDPYLVIEEAFTDQCDEALAKCPRVDQSIGTFKIDPKLSAVRNMIKLFGEVCNFGLEPGLNPQVHWEPSPGARDAHVDVDEGHNILGYFNVRHVGADSGLTPGLRIYDKPSDKPVQWAATHSKSWKVPISDQDPVFVGYKDRQMVILGGNAITATRRSIGDEVHTELSTLPHSILLPDGWQRSRLMIFAIRNWRKTHVYPTP